MWGSDERTGSLFSYVDLEAQVWRDHPLAALSGDFAALYLPKRGAAVDPA